MIKKIKHLFIVFAVGILALALYQSPKASAQSDIVAEDDFYIAEDTFEENDFYVVVDSVSEDGQYINFLRYDSGEPSSPIHYHDLYLSIEDSIRLLWTFVPDGYNIDLVEFVSFVFRPGDIFFVKRWKAISNQVELVPVSAAPTVHEDDAYNVGYNNGLNDGYNNGYDEGRTSGYIIGYYDGQENGYDFGYDDGYDEAYDEGLDTGYSSGYNIGYNDGEEDGYNNGYADGYLDSYGVGLDIGYINGHLTGYDKGYGVGHNAGYSEGIVKNSGLFKSLLASFLTVFDILKIPLLPGLTIGMIVAPPIGLGLISFIIGVSRRKRG